ncbi:CoA ester lyase [Bradyrhizobium sp. U87765 SZCCT0131]|uniref:HpcH/HpaI aldolase/citrate lyase family protein n=1 Tax=unclassified Bradyrhizobium TaxID=2631580 RepID=UPI001BAAC87D|nr:MULTISPECIES: CoA ester lyase [unclassified Bradyrhizobium]MBR1219364.1 CoA ester lyase [Bradyrhizobium sp. U87765 SZCCT0131]MBR1262015.1 CoA ester lyase [Bradyrhizobium sp. U87765 SZCCT0134]MBR1306132.1 CoA ester lyase [Bradyrhizobium sp. U87765 SZCCT0110]MBR1317797.1 CoA ester lyase [Bradyrhizobium sp. U87765 SZCCT0109]MBR1351499.1 CoA ester lyase [Bradyrhizobium sp. U87765 SZCCT0048]
MAIRSYLYAPGNRPDLLAKVLGKGADAVILDLEDAVPPAEKAKARGIVSDFLAVSATEATLLVRLNGGADALADLAALTVRGLHGVLLPKAEDPELIRAVDRLLGAREAAAGVTPGSIIVQPLIESVAGLYGLDALAAASPRIRRFAFGAGDFVRDLRAEPTAARLETLYARQHLVARSRFLGLEAPVAHVFMPVNDLAALRHACEEDRALGFYGRSCIHPAQVPIVTDVFQPGAEALAQAEKILAAYADAMREGRGALVLDDGTFVDEAIAARARDVLARA